MDYLEETWTAISLFGSLFSQANRRDTLVEKMAIYGVSPTLDG